MTEKHVLVLFGVGIVASSHHLHCIRDNMKLQELAVALTSWTWCAATSLLFCLLILVSIEMLLRECLGSTL